jgi:uncharacterized membrane protein
LTPDPEQTLVDHPSGVYWANHHYIIDDVEHVSHGLLWANLGFLFTLSLIPFGTAWVGERDLTPFALSLI